jgi:hypothetical protein
MEYEKCNEEEKKIWDYLVEKYEFDDGIIISAEEVMYEMIRYRDSSQ